jgi:hypothetical protein
MKQSHDLADSTASALASRENAQGVSLSGGEKAWTWPTHPDGTNMTIREMTPEDREIARRRAMWRSSVARYKIPLCYLEDEK